jgi:hypothetical protein
MKIELKRFTTNARLSEETTAFAADVWVDGKNVGYAKNAGRGGNTMVHLDPSVRAAVEAHGKALVPDEYKGFVGGAEWIVDQLVEAQLQKKYDRKLVNVDKKERARCEKLGVGAARFRHQDTWRWFGVAPGADPKVTADAVAAKVKATVDEVSVVCLATRHVRDGRRPLTLVGAHLFEVTATTSDDQTATAVVAADDEWEARTCLMVVQTTMHLRGQLVTYAVRQLDGGTP